MQVIKFEFYISQLCGAKGKHVKNLVDISLLLNYLDSFFGSGLFTQHSYGKVAGKNIEAGECKRYRCSSLYPYIVLQKQFLVKNSTII
jgi:hypothetical protein